MGPRQIGDFGTTRLWQRWANFLDLPVSATTPSRWTITPLFYSQSTDASVFTGVHSPAMNWPQTGEAPTKFAFQALRFMGRRPDNRPDCLLHCSETRKMLVPAMVADFTNGAPDATIFWLQTRTCDHQRA